MLKVIEMFKYLCLIVISCPSNVQKKITTRNIYKLLYSPKEWEINFNIFVILYRYGFILFLLS